MYAGGLFPLNPFYLGNLRRKRGMRGALGASAVSRRAAERGYQPAGTTVLLEADLSVPEPRDPRSVLIRRQAQVEFQDDALPADWWQCLALGDFQLMNARLVSRSDGSLLGHAQAWDMSWFGRGDSHSRIGLISLDVPAAHRRKGYGRFLVSEIFRRAQREPRRAWSPSEPPRRMRRRVAFYASLGFQRVEEATCFRLPSRIWFGSNSIVSLQVEVTWHDAH